MDPLKAPQSVTRPTPLLEGVRTRGRRDATAPGLSSRTGIPSASSSVTPAGAHSPPPTPPRGRPCPVPSPRRQAPPGAQRPLPRRRHPRPNSPGRRRGKLRHSKVTEQAPSAAALLAPALSGYRRGGRRRSRPPRPKRPLRTDPLPSAGASHPSAEALPPLRAAPQPERPPRSLCLPALSPGTRPRRHASAAARAPNKAPNKALRRHTALPLSPFTPAPPHPPPLRHLELGLAESASGP